MSNLGLERHLKSIGLTLHRTPVGDRYVLEHMREHGFNLGGEPSGHIILSDYTTTGDGLVAALQILAVVKRQNRPVSEVCHRFEPLPQVLKNVRYKKGKPLDDANVKLAINGAQARLNGNGRLVIRPSGTEPVIRVMAKATIRSWSRRSSTRSSRRSPRPRPETRADSKAGPPRDSAATAPQSSTNR